MTEINDQDPYAYNAEWHTHDQTLTARIVAVIEDPDGILPGTAKGEPHVIVTGDDMIPLYPMSVALFLATFVRADGSAPQPVLNIPRQPGKADRN